MSDRLEIGSLVSGLTIIGLGLLILLQEEGAIALEPGWLLPAVTALGGAALIATGIAARRR